MRVKMSLEGEAKEQMKTHELNKVVISSSNIIGIEINSIDKFSRKDKVTDLCS